MAAMLPRPSCGISPATSRGVGRFLLTAKLYQLPPPRVKGQRGAPRKKGALIGSPKTLATASAAWQPHPQEAGAFIQSWVGIWHSVFPGRHIRIVVVWRPHRQDRTTPPSKKTFGRLKPLEAFFSTDVSLSPQGILETYADRWAIEIDIRDGHAYYGVAQDQCRKFTHMVGANTFERNRFELSYATRLNRAAGLYVGWRL